MNKIRTTTVILAVAMFVLAIAPQNRVLVENPQPAADGYVPKRDDFRTTFGLKVDF